MNPNEHDGQQPETVAHPQVQEPQFRPPESGRYRDLFEHAPVGFFLLDEDGVIVEVNRAGGQQLGQARGRLTGRRFCASLEPSSQTAFEVFLRRVLASQDRQRIELGLLPPGGQPLQVQLDAVTCPVDHARRCIQVILTDISVLKQAQQGISERNTTLEQLVEARTEQLRELNAELESFVQAVTHELQDPLRQAISLADVLRRSPGLSPEKSEEFSRIVLERVAYMNTLLDALNAYFRRGRQRARFIPVSLERVLRDVKKALAPKLHACPVTWHQDALPTVIGDSRSLQTVFYELLDNALKFSRGRDPIRLAILKQETEAEVHIGVQDNGTGFHMRHREQVFEMFRRLHSGQEFEGLGLGLPLVRRAVLRHGGRVWCESREGEGSTFWVALPKQPTLKF